MENFEVRYGVNALDWDEVNDLFIRAPLGERPPEMFKKACEQSGVVVSIFHDGKLVGFGRSLTDFVAYATVYDVVVLPGYQGQGVGSKIMEAILLKISNCWLITLAAEPGKEKFYEKVGFKIMKTAMAKFKNETGAKTRGFI